MTTNDLRALMDAQERKSVDAARDAGYRGADDEYEMTDHDLEASVEEIVDQLGRVPSCDEWDRAGWSIPESWLDRLRDRVFGGDEEDDDDLR